MTDFNRLEHGVNYDATTQTLYIEPHRTMQRRGGRYGSTPHLVFVNLLNAFEATYPDKGLKAVVWIRPGARLPAPGTIFLGGAKP